MQPPTLSCPGVLPRSTVGRGSCSPSLVGGTPTFAKDSPRASSLGSGEEKHPAHLQLPLL